MNEFQVLNMNKTVEWNYNKNKTMFRRESYHKVIVLMKRAKKKTRLISMRHTKDRQKNFASFWNDNSIFFSFLFMRL